MFKTIRIQNYQSIKDLTLEFDKLNVIVGKSDSGKSAAFRAIQTLVSNKRGADFITYGEKLCTITAETDKGKITLQRGKATNDNFYEIEDAQGVRKFTKLSGTVPEEVTEFFGIEPNSGITFGSQFDKPFLLDSKEYGPSEVARILGALTNVHLLFEGSREAARQKNETSSKLKIRNSDSENTATEINELPDLMAYEELVVKLEGLAEEIEEQSQDFQLLTDILNDVRIAETELNNALTHLGGELPDVSDLQSKVSLMNTLKDLIQRIEADKLLVGKFSDISIDVDTTDLEKQIRLHTALAKLIADIQESTRQISTSSGILLTIKNEIEDLESEYHELLDQEGVCPTCGQKITLN